MGNLVAASAVKRLSEKSLNILCQFDPTFMLGNPSPDAAIETMAMVISSSEKTIIINPASSTEPEHHSCTFDEKRLLKALQPVIQEACDNAIRPYVS